MLSSLARLGRRAGHSAAAQTQAIADLLRWRLYNFVPFNVLRRTYLARVFHARMGSQSYVHSPLRVVGDHRCSSVLTIGANSTVNFGCYLDLRESITIGENTMVGHHCKIYTATHEFNRPTFDLVTLPVVIGDNAVIFPNALVMPGSQIAQGVVVLPGAVFAGESDPWTVYGGVPAKPVGLRNAEVDYRLRYRVWFAQA